MNEIDQDLYSRQIYVLGNQAMVKLTKAKVLLHSVGSLGVEIAKNLILAGIGSLTIIETKTCDLPDLSGQFFISQDHVGLNRGQACLDELKNLNPYVKIELITQEIDLEDVNFLSQFNCVIITDIHDFDKLTKINLKCRQNGVHFILSNTFGLFGYCFTDFGSEFEVLDTDGEDYKDVFIAKITKLNNEFTVETMDQRNHNLEAGDLIKLTEIEGIQTLNGQIVKISKVLNSYRFIFESDKDMVYQRGGVFRKVKQKLIQNYQSLVEQLEHPDLLYSDFNESKFQNPLILHLFIKTYTGQSYDDFLTQIVSQTPEGTNPDYFKTLSKIFYKSQECKFSIYSPIFGGIVAQECLKSITNKFVPIKQWLFLDSVEMYENSNLTLSNDRYDELQKCFGGVSALEKLFNTKLFMVGCGAIGCEMLKNFCLLGLGKRAKITITDNDLIEKSNLNRQFLFRAKDIQRPKSVVAAEAGKKINPEAQIQALESKVCAQSETEFNDNFFQNQTVCVNALDNIEARRYMDSRCVSNQIPLIESGTLGAKGHVQVILPHLTESYNSQKDPNDTEGDVPYCTLKSFPSNIEHCIQWSRDKFESIFKIKPVMANKFIEKNPDLSTLASKLHDENFHVDDLHNFCKFIRNFCFNYSDCINLARIKFEKYFSNKAKDILNIYPSDHLMADGSPFWKLPKREPKAIKFNPDDELHLNFVLSLARLLAEIYGVKDVDDKNLVLKVLDGCQVPEWRPVKKHIETDESKKKTDETKGKDLNNIQCEEIIHKFVSKLNGEKKSLQSIDFEKDNDKNGHIDFIHATSNLRATMYGLDTADKLLVKKIAGKIVPAIATTTSVIAGLATIELIKVIQQEWKFDKFRNTFLNLGISLFLLSEPGPCTKTKITDECYVSLWDKWSIRGSEAFTLKQFIELIKQKYKLSVSGVMYGSKSIYIPVMPGHAKRLNEKMLKLLKGVTSLSGLAKTSENYCDLFLTYEECDNDVDNRDKNNLCPPIRYFFN